MNKKSIIYGNGKENLNMQTKLLLCETLTSLMNECDVDDLYLSKATGVPASTIARLRSRPEANPTAQTLLPLAKFFDITIGQLIGDEPLLADRIPGTHFCESYTSTIMPLLKWEYVESWLKGSLSSDQKQTIRWISSEKKFSEKAYVLEVLTASLGLAFRKGSQLIIEPEKEMVDGDIVLLKLSLNEPFILKHILKDGSDTYMRSLNLELKEIKSLPPNFLYFGAIVETRYSVVQEGVFDEITESTVDLPLLSTLSFAK